tara:strand:- start:4751 stop:5878 length:1128 start_codon:yes stop_codon:yes gene_type:complete
MNNLQSDFRRLMSENETVDEVVFAIIDQNLDDEFNTSPKFVGKIDNDQDLNYILSREDFEDFQAFVEERPKFNMSDDVNVISGLEEMSTTGGGEAYLPGLDVPEKKYKAGYTENVKEDVNSGYKKVKGFRPGHTKDKGGFQYKDLWNLNEDQFNELVSRTDKSKIDRLLDLVKDKAPQLYSKFTNWMLDPYTAHEFEDYKNDAKNQGIDLSAIGLAEREETEQGEFKIGDKVEIIGKWPDKSYGKVISFDDDLVAVNVTKGGGSTYERQMMIPHDQLRLQGSEIKKKEKKEKKKEMEKEPIKEGLKTEIKVRSKKQQFQEATKLANKKLREINHILEYASNLKSDLNETEYSSSSKAMESMKKSIAEAYKKMKNL